MHEIQPLIKKTSLRLKCTRESATKGRSAKIHNLYLHVDICHF
jgi:hypothetical protein